jgi:DNA-directed RNA polymerase specialized sigma54-like protein
MPKPSKKQVRTAIQLLQSMRAEIAEIVRQEILGLPELPSKTTQRAKATTTRRKKG